MKADKQSPTLLVEMHADEVVGGCQTADLAARSAVMQSTRISAVDIFVGNLWISSTASINIATASNSSKFSYDTEDRRYCFRFWTSSLQPEPLSLCPSAPGLTVPTHMGPADTSVALSRAIKQSERWCIGIELMYK